MDGLDDQVTHIYVNSLTPTKRNGYNYKGEIFRQILVLDIWSISCLISNFWMPQDFRDESQH